MTERAGVAFSVRTARRLGWRSFSEIQGSDVVELKRMLHALGYWRPELAAEQGMVGIEQIRQLITTEVRAFTDAGPFYYAEAYHQQYLFKNPGGYCNHGFCQVAYDRQDLTRVELPSA